jgi:hypothetical protein
MELAQADGREGHATGVLIEHPHHLDRPPLDDVDGDVGVEQVLQHFGVGVRRLRVRPAAGWRARP